MEDVVVHVNDLIISRSDVERAEQALGAGESADGATPAEAAERQKNLLRDMIDKQLLLSRGKELGINADAEVIRRLDEIRKQNKLDTMEDLEKAARQQGVSFEDFKAGIRDNVITQMVVRDEVGRRLQMTQGQEQAYYEAHKQEFTQPEQIKLSEILVPTPADANDAAIAQAQAKAEDLEAKLKAGENFEDLAKANSGGPTAAQGGDLGMYKRGALAKVLEDQTFDLKAGEWTAPIRTRQGFVILKVTDHAGCRGGSAEGRGAAGSGGDVRGGDAAGAACLSDEAARRRVHRYPGGICRLRGESEGDQAGVHGVCASGGKEEDGAAEEAV